MPRRRPVIALLVFAAAVVVTACGSATINLDKGAPPDVEHGAQLFAQRCGGCHTLSYAATEGSATTLKNRERVDGPNFNARKEQYDQVLYAIQNGGFSGAIMPQNIVVGQDAKDVAAFLSKYSGRSAKQPPSPTSSG